MVDDARGGPRDRGRAVPQASPGRGAPREGHRRWLAHTTQITRAEAHRHVKLAHQLDHHDPVRDAMAAGQVHTDQAQVICRAVEDLPGQRGLRALGEKERVGLADHYDAKALRVHGRRVLAIVDPDAADAHEAALLDLGHQRLFHDEAQRLAVALTQRHCQHPTCNTPA